MPSIKYNPSRPVNVLFVSTFSIKHGAAVSESLGSEVLAGHLIGKRGNAVKVDHVDLQLDPNIGDLAKRIVREYDAAGDLVREFVLPYTLGAADLILPP